MACQSHDISMCGTNMLCFKWTYSVPIELVYLSIRVMMIIIIFLFFQKKSAQNVLTMLTKTF